MKNICSHSRLMMLALAYALAASVNAVGSVALDGAVSTGKSTNTVGNSITVTNTTGTGDNRLMLVGVSWNANTLARTISSVNFTPNGGSALGLTGVRTQQVASTFFRYAAIYSLLSPPSGQTGTVTVTFSGSVTNGIVVGVANFAGVDQTIPIGTAAGAGATNTAPSVTLTGLNGDELVFDTVFIGGTTPPGLTNNSSQTRLWTNGVFNTAGAASTKQAAATSVTMSWTASASGPWAIAAVPIKPGGADTTPPGVTINQAAGQADPASASPINFTVVFSEPVADFATGDVTLSGTAGATTGTVTGSGTTYNVAVAGMTGSGTVIATIAASVAHDAAGNGNTASTSTDNTVTYDVTPPTVTINQAAGQADPTSASPINFTVVFSEPVTDFATGDVTLSGTATNGATTATVTGSGTTYNVAVSGMIDSGPIIASIAAGVAHDAAGNPNEASASADNTVTFTDITPPAVAINQAAGQADPTSASPINFKVVFTEPVADFATSGVTLGGTAGATTATVTGSGTTYNVAVSGMTGSGTVIASVGAGVAHDTAGNGNTASTSTDNTVTYDVTAPTVTINQAAGQTDPASTSPINFTVVFSEPVTDFAAGDVTLSGTAGATTAAVTGSGTTYNVAVSGMSNSGTVIASIAAGVAHDAVGNLNEAGTSADNQVAYQPPPFTYVGDIGSVRSNTAGTTLQIPVGPAGVAAGNTIIVGFASRGATTYNVPAITDSAGNTYNLATNAVTYAHGRSYIYYSRVGAALVNGGTISITTSSVSNRVAVASVFSGLLATNVLDQALGYPPLSPQATAQGNNPSVGPTAMTAQANELLIGVIGTEEATDAGIGAWQNDFTAGPQIKSSGNSTNEWRVSLGYRLVSARGTFTAAKTVTNNPFWAASIATFKAFSAPLPDTNAPIIATCATDQTINAAANCQAAIPDLTPQIVASDDSGSVTITQSPTAGTLAGLGNTVVTITVSDAAANQATCQATITVVDITAPVITACATNMTLPAGANCQAAIPDLTSQVVASDSCGAVATSQSPAPGTLVGLGDTVVTITASDAATNQATCQATITVVDVTAPTITTCATSRTLPASANCQAPIPDLTSQVVADDSCGAVTISQSPAPGTLVGLGDTVVTITASDAATNEATCQATVTVVDVTAPTITTCATNITVSASANCQATIPELTSQVVASDSCSAVTLTQSPAAGTPVGLGDTVVTITASDAATNQAACQATLTVVDVTAPTITTCATNTTVSAGANCQAAIPDLTAQVVASDSCGAVTLTQSPTAGTLVGLGDTVVTIIASDAATNQATCQATLTVVDVTAPTITMCATNTTVSAGATCQAAIPDLTAQVVASDSCGPVMITQSPVAGTLVGLGDTVVTLTASDAATNTATCQATISVVDVTPPVITACATNMTLNAGTNCQAMIPDLTPQVVANDACGGGVMVTQSPAAGTLVGLGNTVVTLTASDAATNEATCEATITIVDGYAPNIAGQPLCVTNLMGTTDAFTVTATSCSAMGYQWMLGTNLLIGETAATLTITNIQLSNAGDYTVVLANTAGSTTSAVASLTVLLPAAPTLVTGPTVLPNGHFHAGFTGTPNVPYTVECADEVTGTWQTFTNTTSDVNGAIEIDDASVATLARRFYRVGYP